MSNKKKSKTLPQKRVLLPKRNPWWRQPRWGALMTLTLAVAVTIGLLVTRSVPDSETGGTNEPSATRWNSAWPELPKVHSTHPMQLIRAAYAFAANRPDVVQYLPCYCGCEKQGHSSLEFCFVKSRNTSGVTEWDSMGFT
jgi:hypothetical protein